MKPVIGVLCAAWLVVGATAAEQRDVFGRGMSCDAAATSAVTATVGPFNYYGIAPSVTCPEPTR